MIQDCLIKHKDSQKIALVHGNASITYQELYRRALVLSNSIETNKSMVILDMPNSIEYVEAYFAILFAGKTIIPVNSGITSKELIELSKRTNTDLVLTTKRKGLEVVADYGINILNVTEVDWEEGAKENKEPVTCNEDSEALLLLTSGSTANSKLVPLTHKNIMSNLEAVVHAYSEITQDDIQIIILPMTAAFINMAQFLFSISKGMKIVLCKKMYNVNEFFMLIEKYKITYTALVPSLLKVLAELYRPKKYDISSLKTIICGGEGITGSALKSVREKLGNVHIWPGYGLTEASPVVTSQRLDDLPDKESTTGRPLENVEIKVCDTYYENGIQLGTIYIKGPNVISHYYDDDTPILEDGWFNTGDIGFVDEDGYLSIVGRVKNIIISGGQNIYPEEVEEIIKEYSAIQEVAVYGEKSELYGEIPVAKIVMKPGQQYDDTEFYEFCSKNMSTYKIPKEVILCEEIKKTKTNKIKRNELNERKIKI